jgi:hypothetical protein
MYLNLRNFRRQQWKHDRPGKDQPSARRPGLPLAAAAPAQPAAAPGGLRDLCCCGPSPPWACWSRRSAIRELISTDRLVDALFNPFAANQWTLSNYSAGHLQRRHGQRVPQQPDRHHPIDGHPDHDRRVRGVCVRLDPVPWPRHPVRDRGRPARRAHPDVADPGPQALQRRIAVRHVPRDLAGPHRVRPAAGDLPALQLHLAAAPRPVRVGRDRRRVAPSSRSSGSRCRCRFRPWAPLPSSSSCGSGTTCSSP